MSKKVIITGTTGMVGEGVLHECLNHTDIETVLVINRRACNVVHPKLKEIIHEDFTDFNTLEDDLVGYDAAFLCMGVSSMGLSEQEYTHLTYDLTLALARTLEKINPDMTVCYVSGVGTDSTEKGKIMWGRVKGRTENELLRMSFKQAFMFRPGFIQPTKGLRNANKFYKIINPIIPFLRWVFPRSIISLQEIGLAMIHLIEDGYSMNIIEVADILTLANAQLQKRN